MNTIKLPAEFQSGNSVPVERATITRQRIAQILDEAIEADRQARGEPVAWVVDHIADDIHVVFKEPQIPECYLAAVEVKITPLYASPQPPQIPEYAAKEYFGEYAKLNLG